MNLAASIHDSDRPALPGGRTRLTRAAAVALSRLPGAVQAALWGTLRPADPAQPMADPIVALLARLVPRTVPDGADPAGVATARAQSEAQAPLLAPRPLGSVSSCDLKLAGRPARLHRPARATTPGAALIYYPGGGHVLGSLDTCHDLCRTLADAAGMTVIAFGYRLAPEHPFPAGIEDGVAGYRALVAAAPGLGLDPDRIAVGGDSAGANVAAVVAQTCRPDPHPPAHQFLLVPWVEMGGTRPSQAAYGAGYMLDAARMDWFTRLYLDGADPRDPRASPLQGDVAGTAPATVLTAACDPLRDEGEAYAEALRAAGVPTHAARVLGAPHVCFAIAAVLPKADRALRDAAAAMGRSLQERPS